MRMREKPIHGKKYKLATKGDTILCLGVIDKDFVKFLRTDGKIDTVHKNYLELETIDTAAYEKIRDVA